MLVNRLTQRRPAGRRAVAIALAALSAASVLGACGGGGDKLVVYAGRNENLIRPLLERYAKETGTDISVRYGETSQLYPTILEEGERTRADVFIAQDAGALAALAGEGVLAPLPSDLRDDVDPRFVDPDGRWIALTGRVRVISYATDRVTEAELPQSVFDLADPKWRGRIGFAPTNASFISFVSALRAQVGEQRAKEFLEALEANDAQDFDSNVQVLDAVADGEVDLGLVNHYYLYAALDEDDAAKVANHHPGQQPGGEGTFVNISGVGIVEGSDQREEAERLVAFLLSEEAQRYFRDETKEYPVRRGVEAIDELPPLSSLRQIDVPLSELGKDLERTTELLKEVGLS